MNYYVLAHDLGTSGDKACLFDMQGGFVQSAFRGYPTYFEDGGCAEQDPEQWWSAVCETSRTVIAQAGITPEQVAAISFSAQSSGCLPVDQNGRPLRPRAMIWMDTRSYVQATRLEEKIGAGTQYRLTGNGLSQSMLPSAKIQWIKENEPEVYAGAWKLIGCKEYIIARLTGRVGLTDYSEAQTTGLFSAKEKAYDRFLLESTGIDPQKLCALTDSTTVVGSVLPSAAEALGVSASAKVVMGMMDNPCAAVGAGCMRPGTFVASLGTAAWMGCIDQRLLIRSDYRVNSTYVGFGKYRSSVNSHSCGAAFDWAVDQLLGFHGERRYALTAEAAGRSTAGANGLFFLPAFKTGNCKYYSENASGALVGLRLHQNRDDIARALYEAIAFELMIALEFFTGAGIPVRELRAVGGGSTSQIQCQVVSDVLGVPVTRSPNNRHVGALGAAKLALVGIGASPDILNRLQHTDEERFLPDPARHEQYLTLFGQYKKYYEALFGHVYQSDL